MKGIGTHVEVDIDEGQLGAEVARRMMVRAMSMQRRVIAQAMVNAPVQTGLLRRSISGPTPHFSSPFRVHFDVVATAPYAKFVHDGTRHMKANPFLTRAMKKVARSSVSRTKPPS